MFISAMYDRLSEWSSNLSLLFLASLVLPIFVGESSVVSTSQFVLGIFFSGLSLWLSLRLA